MSELSEIQARIAEVRAERGFVTDPLKIHLMITEEVGEVASELKRLWSKNYDGFDKTRLADELSDVFVLLCALATKFDIDLEAALQSKFFGKDAERKWNSASSEQGTAS